jgi:transcriptional regulator with XRE-family HTH domain
MDFGARIEQERIKRGLSRTRLGAKVDLSTPTIRRIEQSARSLTIETLDKAASELDLTVVINLIPKTEVETSPV